VSQFKIAPTLRASLHYIPGRAGTRDNAQREFAALLAVARAADRALTLDPIWFEGRESIMRALARLTHASKEGQP